MAEYSNPFFQGIPALPSAVSNGYTPREGGRQTDAFHPKYSGSLPLISSNANGAQIGVGV